MFYKHHSSSLLWLYLGNSQMSVYRTIGPTLVVYCEFESKYMCRSALVRELLCNNSLSVG